MAISRKTWGGGPIKADNDGTRKTKLVFHHSVDPNRSWTAGRERERMRSIQAEHRSRGYSDIGYSYVIFPSGRIYVGRGRRAIPAANPPNSGTIAICLIGNFERTLPTLRARLRFLAAGRNLKRAVRTLKFLGGHRDLTPTACPGGKLYAKKRKYARILRLKPL